MLKLYLSGSGFNAYLMAVMVSAKQCASISMFETGQKHAVIY